MAYGPDTEELAKWDKEDSSWQGSGGWAFYNMNDPAVVAYGIKQIVDSAKMFGWAGVRFDGHFQARTGKQRVGDRFIDFTPDMADAQTAANQHALKEAMRKVDPRFVYGYNYAECAFNGLLAEHPRETIELCAGGGHIMDEYAKWNTEPSHPFRRWVDYAHMLAQSADQVRRLDGHYFPMVQPDGPVGRYQSIFTFAAGGHPNGSAFYNGFATRFAGVLWDKHLENVWNPAGLLIIGPGLLWEDYVRRQTLDAGHQRLIIHLINPPAQETAPASKAALDELNRREKQRDIIKVAADKEKKTPDYGELDKLPPVQLYPDPKKDIAVRIVPRAFGTGWSIAGARLLDPETSAISPLHVDATDRYFSQLLVPEVKFWAVVVVELEKKEN